MKALRVCDLPGRVPYADALGWQRRLARRRIDGELRSDLLLLLEHEPVVTLGRGAGDDRLVASAGLLAAHGIETVEIERGGDVTYHGPGQLVGYPILDLRRHRPDLHWYMRTLEQALIASLAELGLEAFAAAGYTGVWVGEPAREEELAGRIASGAVRKIASIGVHVSRWVTWHGFALNVTPEPLDSFRLIVPCGIEGVRMTSLASEGIASGMPAARDAVRLGFGTAFGVEIQPLSPERLQHLAGAAPAVSA